jgi:hypothetical protein
VVPARDALTRVVRRGRIAIAVTCGQFMCQLAGIVVAGWAGRIGEPALLVGQAVILAAGAVAVSRLAPAPPAAAHRHDESRLAAMRDGLREVARSERILPVIVAMLAVGVLYGGAFAVIPPLIVRDVYGGGLASWRVNTCFWGGRSCPPTPDPAGALRRPGTPCCSLSEARSCSGRWRRRGRSGPSR